MRRPTDITQVAFIAGSGTQYIVTDIHLLSTDKVVSKWRFQNVAGNVYGCFSGSNDNDNFCLYAGGASTSAYIRYDGQLVREFKPTSGTIYELEQGPDGFFVDGNKVVDFTEATFTCDAPMYIFMLPNSSSAKVTARCYGLQVIRGGNVIYDFVPAINEVSGEVGMWEAVLGTWYGNAGTGSFTSGTVIDRVIGTTHDGWRRRLMKALAKEFGPLTGYSIYGSPTISNGMMTLNSVLSGIITPEPFSPGAYPWEIQTRVLYEFTRYAYFLVSCLGDGTEAKGVGMQMDNGNTIRFLISTNGTSWNVGSNTGTTRTYPADTWVWIKVGWDGRKYYHSFSTDNENWSTNTRSNSTPVYPGNYILFGEGSSVRYSHSTWDLNNTRIYINNRLWWKPL